MFNRKRQGADLSALVHHSDRGVQYLSVRYSDRLADNHIVASVGSKGDSYDNALVESFNADVPHFSEVLGRHLLGRG